VKVIGDQRHGGNFPLIDRYLVQLKREIEATPQGTTPLETVFFGGGTPSLLTVEQVQMVLQTLEQHFGFASSLEISLEIDPGTFDRSQLEGYAAVGVNRFSLGVQAFQEHHLQAVGRSHDLADVYQAIDYLHQGGVQNWSLDLISGLPHQTLSEWELSLQEAIEANPPHLSLYDLVIEPQTVFGKRFSPGCAPLPPDDLAATFYRLSQHHLTAAGYTHYEVSNYAKPGFHCRHNRVYWENRPYYGFGMGATSYVNQRRIARPRILVDYEDWVERWVQTGDRFWESYALDDRSDRWLDTLMLGLRLREGVDLNDLAQRWGEDPALSEQLADLLTLLEPYHDRGWITQETIVGQPYPRLQLTDPEGFLFSNQVLATIFTQPLEPNRKTDTP
jgi:oxygen-independent coproporphyrinogen-3 oxidase